MMNDDDVTMMMMLLLLLLLLLLPLLMMMTMMRMMRKKNLAFVEPHITLFTLPAFLAVAPDIGLNLIDILMNDERTNTVTPDIQIGSDGLKLIETLITLNELGENKDID